ncbi:hypothetical protein HH212_22935 [Massilia forsythiae]|uniref:Uncharacterized protein n=1 Tax=Massilia forsythiae TaxID=2728020 RepID=A0A7Z2VZY0_9BURK|nr:hypothetical protein [Massilia forsythiae]QJE02522.1 hypothetical protein HH212_22935 [Massilia forsythiae]
MDDEKIIREVIERIEWPDDIHGYDLEFTPDWSGAPSVYINLHIDDDYHPSKDKIGRLSRVRREIADELLDMGLDYFPYVKLVAED